MEELYSRLRLLRTELENSTTSPENGLSVLYALRRELLRYYLEMPLRQLLICPIELQKQFYQAQQALQQPPAFPTPSASAQYTNTALALRVLEQVVSCTKEQKPLLA